ncbi:hypothetical protein C496_15667 [Natronorubrum tibetense GA33]|uniref:Uncharacterized protein n=1 Tax=Natronorubrum tibetense GA33 TaxID=1114856 RepID=L9VRF8_9EURY|nr:hypothetical protein C496_15667 [Natronorubrum tibetense GA33]
MHGDCFTNYKSVRIEYSVVILDEPRIVLRTSSPLITLEERSSRSITTMLELDGIPRHSVGKNFEQSS